MDDVSAFNEAIWRGEAATVARLVQKVDPDGEDRWHRKPLAMAAQYGDLALVTLLLGRGAAADAGRTYLTPITYAARRGAPDLVSALRDAGATVLPYQPPEPEELIYLWLAAISSDGGATLRRQLAADPVCAQLRPMMYAALLPSPLRTVLARVLDARGDHRLARLLRSVGNKPVAELWQLTAQRTALRYREIDAWNAQELDAVVLPPHVLPAMPLGTSGDLTLTLSYLFRYVMLNFPAGIVPVTRVREDETRWPGPEPLDTLSRHCADVLRGAAGLPVGVQVAARPYREDVALAVMGAIEARVQTAEGFPRTPIDPVPAR